VGVETCHVVDDVGWIGDLGVVARARGRGVGRALLERGFELLAARGLRLVQLNVDSQNETGATRLYESVDMTVRRSFDCYEKRLVAG
jgi:mycothiol synthase